MLVMTCEQVAGGSWMTSQRAGFSSVSMCSSTTVVLSTRKLHPSPPQSHPVAAHRIASIHPSHPIIALFFLSYDTGVVFRFYYCNRY